MKRVLEGNRQENPNKKTKHASSEEAVIETSSEGTQDNSVLNSSSEGAEDTILNLSSRESEKEGKTIVIDSPKPNMSSLEIAESVDAIKYDSILNEQLEEMISDSLNEIDKVANEDSSNTSEHLRNTLKAIKGVFDSPSAYRSKLEKLYEQDLYMLDASDAIADIVLMVNGELPVLERFFKTTESKDLDFTDYILEVRNEVANILVNRYSDFITCNEDFELTLVGE